MYDYIDWLHYSQALYHDTDSCIYDPDNPDHINPDYDNQKRPDLVSMGKGLGQWSNELDADKGEFITEFVATGPKSYAYKTNLGRLECKAEGLTLDVTSAKYITLNRMKNNR